MPYSDTRTNPSHPMRALGLALLLPLLLLLMGVGALRAQTPDAPASGNGFANLFSTEPLPIPPFAPGVVLVGLREDVVSAAGVLEGLQINAAQELDLRGLDGGAGTGGVHGARLQVPPGQEWAVIEQLQQDPGVVFAEPDWIVQVAEAPIAAEVSAALAAAPEVPYAVSDTLYEGQWYLQRINLSRGWATAQSAGLGDPVHVAIIDTGVDYGHPDLDGVLLPGFNYVAPNTSATPAADDNGHGTHVAGLIGALANNRSGMAGSALDVTLEPYKVLGADGTGFVSSVAGAIRHATDNGARIINLSLEIPRSIDSSVLRSAVAYAATQDVLLVAAAGNCLTAGCVVFYPAAYENVLAVGATSDRDVPVYYSAVGPEIDLVAPGGGDGPSILSAWAQLAANKCSVGLRVVDKGIYCPKDGTSMAAAIVTGVAALIWSMDDDLTAQEVAALLAETAVPLAAPENRVGAGRLDAAAAVRYVLPPRLRVSQNVLRAYVFTDSAASLLPLTVENSSLAPMTWAISPTRRLDWLAIDGPAAGSVRYGVPVQPHVVITPSLLAPGRHTASLLLTGITDDGNRTVQTVAVDITVNRPLPAQRYVALVSLADTGERVWLEPGDAERTTYALSGSVSWEVSLPFSFTLHSQTIETIRLHADGYVTFSDAPGGSSLPNRCLPNLVEPPGGVYGWWADLEPGARGAQVSTFQPDPDRFVIEYAHVPVAGVSPGYVVSFQIVLHRSGRIDLHYGALPDARSIRPQATVGVRLQGGLFYNQVACRAGEVVLGRLPAAYESITLEPKDLY